MSEVISFRLDKANPREAQALEVLNAWIKKGFNARFILTKALLELDQPGPDLAIRQDDQGLRLVLDHIGQLFEILSAKEANTSFGHGLVPEPPVLHEKFLVSIKQGAKPGIKLD